MRTVFFCVHVINYESNARDYFMTKVNCKQPWLVAGGVGGPVQPGPVPSGPVERAARGLARTRRLQSEGCAVHLGGRGALPTVLTVGWFVNSPRRGGQV